MTFLGRLLIAGSALLLLAGAPLARPLTEAEARSLAETVEAFDAAMRSNDYEIVVKTIPPRVITHIAKQAGIEVDALRALTIEQMKATLAEVKLLSFGMDLSKAEHRELPGGEPYVLIPTETVMETVETGKMAARSQTLALLDAGVWYLVRVDDVQQVMIVRQVYPEFAGVEFSSGSWEALKE
jgi:hypothetical protein